MQAGVHAETLTLTRQMAVTDDIVRNVERLPEPLRAEVLHFAEYLVSRTEANGADGSEASAWSAFSLASAMRGIEDAPGVTYSETDIIEAPR